MVLRRLSLAAALKRPGCYHDRTNQWFGEYNCCSELPDSCSTSGSINDAVCCDPGPSEHAESSGNESSYIASGFRGQSRREYIRGCGFFGNIFFIGLGGGSARDSGERRHRSIATVAGTTTGSGYPSGGSEENGAC
jgi:hypothetical protein